MTTLRLIAAAVALAALGACSTDKVIDNTVGAGAFAVKSVAKAGVAGGRAVSRVGSRAFAEE